MSPGERYLAAMSLLNRQGAMAASSVALTWDIYDGYRQIASGTSEDIDYNTAKSKAQRQILDAANSWEPKVWEFDFPRNSDRGQKAWRVLRGELEWRISQGRTEKIRGKVSQLG